jgi:pyruvate/2-oxoglutarate dehydrogenase complex dihydrolipoamide dehydrogenase (E3) component
MAGSLNPDSSEWDVVVVGGGPPGQTAARYATRFSGLNAVVVESERVGGDCHFWACIPSKAMLSPVHHLSAGQDVAGVKELVTDRHLDVPSVLRRRDAANDHLDDGDQVAGLLRAGVDVLRGRGRLSGERTVVVRDADDRERPITARHAVVLATGSLPRVPPVPGLREARPWFSRDATGIQEVPDRVLVLGGGPVACEAVTWLRAFGARNITVVGRSPRLLARAEPFVGDALLAGFRAAGVDVRLGQRVDRVERAEVNDAGPGLIHGGPVTVRLDGGDVLTVDEVLVATGRVPASVDLGLQSVGLAAGEFLSTDGHMTVKDVPGQWLYAVGDVCGPALMTHMGKYQARIAGEVIAARAAGRPLDTESFNRHTDVVRPGRVPQVIFTDPEVAMVGLTEQAAREQGFDVEVVESDFGNVAGAFLAQDTYRGRAKLVVDARADVIIGATFMGIGMAEMLHAATAAVVAATPIPTLWHAVPSFPTVSEVWLRLLEALDNARQRQLVAA